MKQAARVGDRIIGYVSHHAGHIIEYDSDGDPIYCDGHMVSGIQTTGAKKVYIEGKLAARIGDTGTTNCPCDGRGFTNTSGSSKVFIEGKPAARLEDMINIHGAGTGQIISASSKVWIG